MAPTFRERYCQRWSISTDEFEQHLLPRVLYLHARPLHRALALHRGHFAADREFLRNVGDIRSRRFFHAEAAEFHDALQNQGVLHRWLRLRVSAERTRRLMEDCWERLENAAALPSVSER
jgi:hypothetical protein